MEAIADVAPPDRSPCESLAEALADYPGTQLWTGIHGVLPRESAALAFDAAAATALRA